MTKILNSNNNEITIWGKGNEKRDLLYVEDLCNFVELAIKKQKNSYEVFNVGSGKLISVKNLAKKIAFQAKKKLN